MKNFLALSLVAVLALGGCALHVNHPGTANTFDSDTYDTLSVTDNVIESTKTAYLAGQFPAAIAPNVKTALNDLIAAYDVAETLYCNQGSLTVCAPTSYHAMAAAGTATAAQQTALQNQINTVNTKTTALASAKGTK